ncbi:P-loop containing nucleoside triphosphate hydrolase protein [Trametes coccinea BRFM310]|uniref:p-loop containing nucleoside triphosphate hydrolase protein n=1 Tax=Trametes coccinea (strain BRFM310) TaxID=1353009 RepID=A0A1Y2IDX7_TRAC3|nr:P-loop containing nucleoside triphosphate hydrolase protein [Trametes coccinea BRFM310]
MFTAIRRLFRKDKADTRSHATSSLTSVSSTSTATPSPANEKDIHGAAKAPQSAGAFDLAMDVPPSSVKYFNQSFNTHTNAWEYKNASPFTSAQLNNLSPTDGVNSKTEAHYFSVVRTLPQKRDGGDSITVSICINNSALLRACKDAVVLHQGCPVVAFESAQVDPKTIIAFFPILHEYAQSLFASVPEPTTHECLVGLHVLLKFMRDNYGATLSEIESLKARGETTFSLAYAFLVPGSIVVSRCEVTKRIRAYRLQQITKHPGRYSLVLSSLEAATLAAEDMPGTALGGAVGGERSRLPFGMHSKTVGLESFKGVKKINALRVYPLQFAADPEALRTALVKRGRKWAALNGVHHVQYDGIATHPAERVTQSDVHSRIIIDRDEFLRANTNSRTPILLDSDILRRSGQSNGDIDNKDASNGSRLLSNSELLLASPVLYGFSLGNKLWMEFDVENVSPIAWNHEAFHALALAPERKDLLRSLVEAHNAHANFDDIIRGKGQGLVINLFGPPGVGKTLSAEATSDYLQRPLYVLTSGCLGTDPETLDRELRNAFELATHWNAIILIDEADVFLEERSAYDLQHNAMVAVFLRQLEYYHGILFLTTNRITAFDEAFLSRIHVALQFTKLSIEAKAQIWRQFLEKAEADQEEFTQEVIEKLAKREINGRQIKNVCRTATSLARMRGEKLRFAHLVNSLDAMEEFEAGFKAMKSNKA